MRVHARARSRSHTNIPTRGHGPAPPHARTHAHVHVWCAEPRGRRWQQSNDAPCVQKAPASYDGILLGDVVFQSLVIEFDLTKPKKPLIGVAPRNPLYVPTAPGQEDALKIPLIKRDARGIYVEDPRRDKFRHGVDHVPVVMGIGRTAFLANISIGSPRQSFTVLLDTVAS